MMIKNWKKFNESFKKGQKIQAKIDILREISNDLTDVGLSVDIWSGSWKDDNVAHSYMKKSDGFSVGDSKVIKSTPASKFIIMMINDENSVLDENNYYEEELINKKEIKEFEEDLISHGMRPKHKKWFSNYVYFYFDKGKSTDTDILTNYKD
jgi:hypothetical protein